MTGLLGARACMWTGTGRIRRDEQTGIIKPDTLWRWKRLIPWKTAGRVFFHMKRRQFYISLLPSFSLYLFFFLYHFSLSAVCRFGNTEIHENWNLPFGGVGWGLSCSSCGVIVFPTHSIIFFLDVSCWPKSRAVVPNLRSGCPIPQGTRDCSFFCSELEKLSKLSFWAY